MRGAKGMPEKDGRRYQKKVNGHIKKNIKDISGRTSKDMSKKDVTKNFNRNVRKYVKKYVRKEC